MNNQSIIIGHYGTSAYTDKDSLLSPLTQENFNQVVEKVKPWNENLESYRVYKTSLPILFFTHNTSRPKKGEPIWCSGYGCIDIDDGGRYVSEHPAVCCINYTPHGTHIFFHWDGSWGRTAKEWQDTYNSITYEIWREIQENEGKVIQFDGHSSSPYQGIFLWNTEWVGNKAFNREWQKTDHFLSSSTLEEMYKEGSYKAFTPSTPSIYEWVEGNINLNSDMKEKFNRLSYQEFLSQYETTYQPTRGTRPLFTPYTDYEGNIYDMYETKGRAVRMWMPWMRNHKNEDGTLISDFRIEKGGRRRSLWLHLSQVKQYLGSTLTLPQLLYDAVYWVRNYCKDAENFSKKELMETVYNRWKIDIGEDNDYLLPDPRRFITGSRRWDTETGEEVGMEKGDKIRANAKCRKTERIRLVVKMYDPEKTMEENLQAINSWEEDLLPHSLNLRLMKDYLLKASLMEDLKEEYPWLENVKIEKMSKEEKGRKGGRIGGKKSSPKKEIVIKDKQNGKISHFKSKTECREWLRCSSDTFCRFLNGSSKFNYRYEVVK